MTRQQQDTFTADRLWADYARTHSPRTCEALVRQFERLAYSIANRFARRGPDSEDVFQVAMIGLVKAVDRFDPSTHNRFRTFATPTILGEIRRYFRDHSRSIRVPRGLQTLAWQVEQANLQLRERLGRNPTSAELAKHLEVPEKRVQEALALEGIHSTLSIDGQITDGPSDRSTRLEEALGSADVGLAHAEDSIGIDQAMSKPALQLQQIIELRYLRELSQREVARRLGTSQMRICRMERRALDQLRTQFSIH